MAYDPTKPISPSNYQTGVTVTPAPSAPVQAPNPAPASSYDYATMGAGIQAAYSQSPTATPTAPVTSVSPPKPPPKLVQAAKSISPKREMKTIVPRPKFCDYELDVAAGNVEPTPPVSNKPTQWGGTLTQADLEAAGVGSITFSEGPEVGRPASESFIQETAERERIKSMPTPSVVPYAHPTDSKVHYVFKDESKAGLSQGELDAAAFAEASMLAYVEPQLDVVRSLDYPMWRDVTGQDITSEDIIKSWRMEEDTGQEHKWDIPSQIERKAHEQGIVYAFPDKFVNYWSFGPEVKKSEELASIEYIQQQFGPQLPECKIETRVQETPEGVGGYFTGRRKDISPSIVLSESTDLYSPGTYLHELGHAYTLGYGDVPGTTGEAYNSMTPDQQYVTREFAAIYFEPMVSGHPVDEYQFNSLRNAQWGDWRGNLTEQQLNVAEAIGRKMAVDAITEKQRSGALPSDIGIYEHYYGSDYPYGPGHYHDSAIAGSIVDYATELKMNPDVNYYPPVAPEPFTFEEINGDKIWNPLHPIAPSTPEKVDWASGVVLDNQLALSEEEKSEYLTNLPDNYVETKMITKLPEMTGDAPGTDENIAVRLDYMDSRIYEELKKEYPSTIKLWEKDLLEDINENITSHHPGVSGVMISPDADEPWEIGTRKTIDPIKRLVSSDMIKGLIEVK